MSDETKRRITDSVITAFISVALSLILLNIFWGGLARANEMITNHETRISVVESNLIYIRQDINEIKQLIKEFNK